MILVFSGAFGTGEYSATYPQIIQYHAPKPAQSPPGIHLQHLLYLLYPFPLPRQDRLGPLFFRLHAADPNVDLRTKPAFQQLFYVLDADLDAIEGIKEVVVYVLDCGGVAEVLVDGDTLRRDRIRIASVSGIARRMAYKGEVFDLMIPPGGDEDGFSRL